MFQRQLTFKEAVDKVLMQNYCNFSGRASRSEYWWYVLFTLCLNIAVGIVFCWSKDVYSVVNGLIGLGLLLPGLGVAVRRLHDINKSGWWVLIAFVPIVGAILLIVWFCKNSDMTPNQYGPVPYLETK